MATDSGYDFFCREWPDKPVRREVGGEGGGEWGEGELKIESKGISLHLVKLKNRIEQLEILSSCVHFVEIVFKRLKFFLMSPKI